MHLTWLSFFTWWYCLEIVLIKAQMHNTCSFFLWASLLPISSAKLIFCWCLHLTYESAINLSLWAPLCFMAWLVDLQKKKYVSTNTESPPTTNINEISELLFKNNWITGYGETKNQVRSLNWCSISSKEMAKL